MRSKKGIAGLIVAVLLLAVALTIGGLIIHWIAGYNNPIPPVKIANATLQGICESEYAEHHTYSMGWSETCGFPVHRGFCVRRGKVIDNHDYAFGSVTLHDFEMINDLLEIEEGQMSMEDMREWVRWEQEVCEILTK